MPPASGPHLVRPAGPVWRVGWASAPLNPPAPKPIDLASSDAGNRFDSITGQFRTLYFGTTRRACLAETLAWRRPKPSLVELIKNDDEWQQWMQPATVEQAWRHGRLLVAVELEGDFLDIHHSRSVAWIERVFGSVLATLGYSNANVSTLMEDNRTVSRHLAEFLHNARDKDGVPVFAGIRYNSKLGNDLENWALFDRGYDGAVEVDRTTIDRNDPDYQAVCELYGLTGF